MDISEVKVAELHAARSRQRADGGASGKSRSSVVKVAERHASRSRQRADGGASGKTRSSLR